MNRQHAAPAIAGVDFGRVRIGESLPVVEFCVDERTVDHYALATTGACGPSADAPPLALVALALAAMTEVMPLPPSTIHVGQDVDFLAPVAVGSVVTARFQLDRRRGAGNQVFSSFSFDLAAGRQLCARGRLVLRTSASDFGAAESLGRLPSA